MCCWGCSPEWWEGTFSSAPCLGCLTSGTGQLLVLPTPLLSPLPRGTAPTWLSTPSPGMGKRVRPGWSVSPTPLATGFCSGMGTWPWWSKKSQHQDLAETIRGEGFASCSAHQAGCEPGAAGGHFFLHVSIASLSMKTAQRNESWDTSQKFHTGSRSNHAYLLQCKLITSVLAWPRLSWILLTLTKNKCWLAQRVHPLMENLGFPSQCLCLYGAQMFTELL